jgi:hypothetical protein
MTKNYNSYKYITNIDISFSAMRMNNLAGKFISKETYQ